MCEKYTVIIKNKPQAATFEEWIISTLKSIEAEIKEARNEDSGLLQS